MGRVLTLATRGIRNGEDLALRAFVAGTCLCASWAGLSCYAVHRYYGVNNLREFADVMREVLPRHVNRVGAAIGPTVEPMVAGLRSGLESIAQDIQGVMPNRLKGLHDTAESAVHSVTPDSLRHRDVRPDGTVVTRTSAPTGTSGDSHSEDRRGTVSSGSHDDDGGGLKGLVDSFRSTLGLPPRGRGVQ